MKKEYPALTFINRKKETEYFVDHLKNLPRNILFVYGPKSTGKTTLVKKIIQELPQEKFDITFLNLREKFIVDFKSFRKTFFPPNLKERGKEILSNAKFSVPGFSWTGDDEEMIQADIFGTMIRKMEELREQGIMPVIIIDEFQYLKDITVDIKNKKEIFLIEELFKFFIALTKQNNLAHVICMTSDSYYMEELYSDTKLTNTSKFYHIEHLSYNDVKYWLTETEDCSEEMFEEIWEHLGGSVWEIWMVFVAYKNGQDWRAEMKDLIQNKFAVMSEFAENDMEEKLEERFLKITKVLAEKGEYTVKYGDGLFELIKIFVDQDIWFYDMKFRKITPNSKSQQMAMKMFMQRLEEER